MSTPTPSLSLAAASAPSAADVVIGTLREEHRSVRSVLQVVDTVLGNAELGATQTDVALLCACLYYMDAFPERVHHPKEDEHVFSAIRRRTGKYNAVLDALQGEHIRTPRLMSVLQRELIHYQAGAPAGLKRLRTSFDVYAGLLQDHMRTEETLFRATRAVLTVHDWCAIADAIQVESDPLAMGSTRREFRLLRARIVNLLPPKLKLQPPAEA